MANYILQYRGKGAPDLQQVKATLHACKAKVLDDSLLPHTALLQLEDAEVETVRTQFEADWSLTPEKKYHVPDTRRKTD